MLKATFKKFTLRFKRPGGTSRGVLKEKDSYFIFVRDDKFPVVIGIGECGLLRGLSIDDRPDYESKLAEVCNSVHRHEYWIKKGLLDYPSIRFGLEMAIHDLHNRGSKVLFPTDFVERNKPIPINGLIWMGSPGYMVEQIQEKLDAGFRCIKMKIGAINFEEELKLLKEIRKEFSPDQIELRVDANGAFPAREAREKMKRLAEFRLHSIEQPIASGQWEEMARLCQRPPLPVALDEELIPVVDSAKRKELLDTIQPQYLVLKPSLLGGLDGTSEWITLAEERNIPWWVTSALESNIGLNAIAQWTATFENDMVHGLGTGQLYTNNIPSPLLVENGALYFGFKSDWDLTRLFDES